MARPLRSAPPPQAPDNAAALEGPEETADAAPAAGRADHQGSILAGLATAPLWAPLGAGSPHPMARAPLRDLAAPADPAAMPVTGHLTPGARRGRSPLAPLLEPAHRPRPPGPVPP